MTSRIQRVQQGIRALLAFAISPDFALAQYYLSDREYAIFRQMSRAEQLHSLNVLRDVLLQMEQTPRALAVAALMHDCGKSRYHLAVWQKTIAVLVKAFIPKVAIYLARDETLNFWRAPFVVREYHPRWSAEILRACGSDEVAIWLVAHHQQDAQCHVSHDAHALLCRLQQADDAN